MRLSSQTSCRYLFDTQALVAIFRSSMVALGTGFGDQLTGSWSSQEPFLKASKLAPGCGLGASMLV